MFWKLTALSASSPVESVLDKENFTLEELLDEEEIIQECKALNSRLINLSVDHGSAWELMQLDCLLDNVEVDPGKYLLDIYVFSLRDRTQVEQLLNYVVIEPPEDAESKRAFKFPFIACEIFTCEIDVILKTLVEEEELMNLLFSFLEPNRPHSALLAGYFSKVVVCLMIRKTVPLMNYVQVESVLDKENFTLEELLDEEEIIQECKALNSRLINLSVDHGSAWELMQLDCLLDNVEVDPGKYLLDIYVFSLRDRTQVEQLLNYVVIEPPEDAESKRAFKFPFIACEIFTCEIDVILKTLVEEEELMNLLFSFLEPNRPHSALLAGYFSKVVVCLMIRKTVPLMNYVQAHQDVFCHLVDLIGITSIMEVLVRLVGADDHVYPNYLDVMQWLAESNLLEMIVDKLSPSSPPEVHANAAETLCAITRNASSPLATKLSSPSQHMYEPPISVNPETIGAMLPKLGDLLTLLNVSSDGNILPTTYGELRPPLGKHRLKIVEFIAVLLKTANDAAENELVSSGTIQRIIDLFFEYPYNNSLHHHVESIILSCLESKSDAIVNHLLRDCNLVGKILVTDKHPILSGDSSQPTMPASGRQAPRVGNLGHITRISNKLVQVGSSHNLIQACLQENSEWNEWQTTVVQERNAVENVYRWACGRPTALQDRTRDSDDDDLHDRDYDVAALANNLSQAFRYKIYGNDDAEEDHGAHGRDDEDVYFDDESAEVVISSLRLGDEQGSSLFTNSNWFAFQDDRVGNAPVGTSEMMDEINLNGTANGGNSSSDDEVVVGEDEELTESKDSVNGTSSSSNMDFLNVFTGSGSINGGILNKENEKASASHDMGFFRYETHDNEELFGDRPLPDWVGWGDSPDPHVGGSSVNPFDDHYNSDVNPSSQAQLVGTDSNSPPTGVSPLPNGSPTTTTTSDSLLGSDSTQRSAAVPSLFEEDVEFVGVELEGTEKAMEQALKEGIVGEAGPLKRNIIPKALEKENSDEGGPGMKEFNDANYWRVDQEVAVLE
ncbi:Serine/threonine-protein phosphatase 6 regulatory subunit 3 [Morella rubra]|uniref:Serine/threonine-protein phosphatase 6 regulatory subunit 3 n=1 Tax=Morella rubra TaxID=262757 RepID=A0A6A1WM86_9ROSI|nr:Serine/threonine-protein phosphatase 6 regulatory subunit 3 [Morella rubra]